ncbi:MAG: hypothetical protein ACJ8C4_19380 [Gemmataceae bacterium]
MTKPTLREREKQLQELLPTPDGLIQIQELAARYGTESGHMMIHGTSLITFILVYERDRGLISG